MIVRLLSMVLLVIVSSTRTIAAPRDELMIVPQLGFDGIVPSEHWSPLRFVMMTTGVPFAGTLTVTYTQDGSQRASTTTSFSLMTGITTPVDVGVCLPRTATGVSVAVRTDTGRTILNEYLNFDRPDRSKLAFKPPALVSVKTTMLAIGLDDLAEAGKDWSRSLYMPGRDESFASGQQDLTIERRVRVTAMDPEDLYSFWAAYDGVQSIIVRASVISEIPERARRAIEDWQRGGGELVVVVDDASNRWRRWLPEGTAGDIVDMDEIKAHRSPDVLDAMPFHSAKANLGHDELAQPAEWIQARAVSLLPRGVALGWETDYEISSPDYPALAARGPVGLGFVTLIGFDPARATAVRSKTASSIAWGAMLDRHFANDAANAEKAQMWYYTNGSGADPSEVTAINHAADATLKSTGLRGGVLVVIFIVLIGFVVAIGPVDAIVLRRLGLRHWSWLTALAWVGVASVLAVQIPNISLGGQTHFGRVVITDTALDERGEVVTSWATGISTIYAGKTATVGPIDERPGAWWRGVSPLNNWQHGGNRSVGALGVLRQTMQAHMGADGARLASVPSSLIQKGWTARAFLDESPNDPPLRASVTEAPDGWDVEFQPGSPNVTVRSVVSTIGDRFWTSPSPILSDGLHLRRAEGQAIRGTVEESAQYRTVLEFGNLLLAVSELPGAKSRGLAITKATARGNFALIVVEYTAASPGFAVIGADTQEIRGFARLLVPIAPMEPSP